MAARIPVVLGSDGLPQQLQSGDSVGAAIGYAQNLGTSGYQKLPSGLIIQWGQATPSSGTATITFPIAFTTAVYVVNSNPILSGLAATTILASSTLTTSLTGCTIAVRQVASGLSGAANSTAPIQWHAIGV